MGANVEISECFVDVRNLKSEPHFHDTGLTENIHIDLTSMPNATPSFSSYSATAIKKSPHCVTLKASSLSKRGYKSFEEWNSDPNHVYIGRDMSHRVAGAQGSKWGNPFYFDKTNKKSLMKCLDRYEAHIRSNPDLFNAVLELEGKELGCWCKPSPCHGDILVKLFHERQVTNSCISDTPPLCERNQYLTNTQPDFAPLRLNGGGDTSHDMHEDSAFDLDTTPCVQEFETPNVTSESGSDQTILSRESGSSDSSLDTNIETVDTILRGMRVKNVNKVIIGTLNINSLASKFDQLRAVIGRNIDILTIQETKLDDSFPAGQFIIEGYSEPYRLDRNRDGGGVMIYVREDIPSRLLTKHTFNEAIEGMFVEINLRKTKLLFFGLYCSDHSDFGVRTTDYLSQGMGCMISFYWLGISILKQQMMFSKIFFTNTMP